MTIPDALMAYLANLFINAANTIIPLSDILQNSQQPVGG